MTQLSTVGTSVFLQNMTIAQSLFELYPLCVESPMANDCLLASGLLDAARGTLVSPCICLSKVFVSPFV